MNESSILLTEKGKSDFLKAINVRFKFTKEGEMIPKNDEAYEPIILSDFLDKSVDIKSETSRLQNDTN